MPLELIKSHLPPFPYREGGKGIITTVNFNNRKWIISVKIIAVYFDGRQFFLPGKLTVVISMVVNAFENLFPFNELHSLYPVRSASPFPYLECQIIQVLSNHLPLLLFFVNICIFSVPYFYLFSKV